MKPFLIMMYGYPATGKTIRAERLAKKINSELISSWKTRKSLFGQLKSSKQFLINKPFYKKTNKIIYQKLLELAEENIKSNRNVIIDGSYLFEEMRKKVYKMVCSLGAELYIIHCICENEEEIKKRIEKKVREPINMDVYYSSVKYSDKIEGDKLPNGNPPKMIQVDTFNKKIKLINIERKNQILEEILDVLSEMFYEIK